MGYMGYRSRGGALKWRWLWYKLVCVILLTPVLVRIAHDSITWQQHDPIPIMKVSYIIAIFTTYPEVKNILFSSRRTESALHADSNLSITSSFLPQYRSQCCQQYLAQWKHGTRRCNGLGRPAPLCVAVNWGEQYNIGIVTIPIVLDLVQHFHYLSYRKILTTSIFVMTFFGTHLLICQQHEVLQKAFSIWGGQPHRTPALVLSLAWICTPILKLLGYGPGFWVACIADLPICWVNPSLVFL